MAIQPHSLRAEDVPRIPVTDPAISGYELVNGELVPVMPAKRTHSWLAVEVARRLGNHVLETGTGAVFADVWCNLRLPRDPERLRAPDVAYFGDEKLAAAGNDEIFRVLPDLVIEIYSPTNWRRRGDFQQRVRDYLDAGVGLLWVIYPSAGYAMVHRPDGSARMVRETDALEGEDVVPGFRLLLGELLSSIPGGPSAG
jgi:Uma2 family endonuclease